MLRTLEEDQKKKWHVYINKMLHAYNCTIHDSTGFSPYFLMFGREPKLPIDFILEGEPSDSMTHSQYAQQWEEQMKEAYSIARRKSTCRKEKDAERRKHRAPLASLAVGDRVLVKNVERGGPGKLRSYWEQNCYVVIDQKGGENGVVYTVQKENKPNGKMRVVHRNMLLPLSTLFQFNDDAKPVKLSRPGVQKAGKGDKRLVVERTIESSTESGTECDDEWGQLYPNDLEGMISALHDDTPTENRTIYCGTSDEQDDGSRNADSSSDISEAGDSELDTTVEYDGSINDLDDGSINNSRADDSINNLGDRSINNSRAEDSINNLGDRSINNLGDNSINDTRLNH